MASRGKIEIEKFNCQSFELWKLKMEDLLVDKDQWISVDPGEATAKALWDKLGTLYQSKSLVNKLFMRKKLYNLRMKDGDSVTEHLNAFNTMCPKTQDEEEDMSRVPYASAVGSLMYAMVCTRPDIAHAVGVLSRFMSKPGKEHWTAVKRVFRYLRGTSDYGLCYQGRPGLDRVLDIRGFVDADWAGDLDQRRSTSGYVFNLFGGAVSWMSKKQSVVALSTTEAEYMAATHASKEAVWLQRLCSSMGLVQGAIRIDCDSQSAIFLAKNPAYHSKTKHIDVQYHFVRDMIEDKKVLLVKVDTLKNTADALTKSVNSEKFSWCRETMGVLGLEK
eukprot:PITA_27130